MKSRMAQHVEGPQPALGKRSRGTGIDTAQRVCFPTKELVPTTCCERTALYQHIDDRELTRKQIQDSFDTAKFPVYQPAHCFWYPTVAPGRRGERLGADLKAVDHYEPFAEVVALSAQKIGEGSQPFIHSVVPYSTHKKKNYQFQVSFLRTKTFIPVLSPFACGASSGLVWRLASSFGP